MNSPIVELNKGLVKGKIDATPSGFPFYSFQGMRYAKPPLLQNRFKDSEFIDSWKGIYEATSEGYNCPQLNSLNDVFGNEDCLFINVYIPKITNLFSMVNILLPVMVWIHGGGFISGSGDTTFFGPDYIVENNVILVTLNYRLGVLGFMNLGTENVSGNAGLKDQVMALKWVQENIQAFGGNPENVIIFGESTGGASVQYLMISSMAKGLFHKVISHSGSCLSSWSFVSESVDMFERAFNLSKMIGKSSRNATKLLEILQNVSEEELVKKAYEMRTFDDKMRDAAFVFAPSIENLNQPGEKFLSRLPIKNLLSGNFSKVPYMSGFNSDEGIYYIHYARRNKDHIDTLNRDFQYVIPTDMNLEMNSDLSVEVARLIKKFYFQDGEIDNSTYPAYIDLYTDYAFLYKIIESSNIIRNFSNNNVYFYKFSFDGEFNFFKINNNLNYSGACHLDDLGYLFHQEGHLDQERNMNTSKMVRKRMVQLWTNFAKYGNPTPYITEDISTIWEPVTSEALKYLEINEKLKMKINPEEKRMKFWNKLYKYFSNNTREIKEMPKYFVDIF